MGSHEITGGRFFFECHEAWKTSIEFSIVLGTKFAWRGFRYWNAGLVVAPFHVDRLLGVDSLSSRAVGNQNTINLARLLPLVMQRATRATGMHLCSVLQQHYRFVLGMNSPAADVALLAG